MFNIEYFIKALKLSWVQRILKSNGACKAIFESIIGCNINSIFKFGKEFLNKKANVIKNIFWKEVLSDLYIFLNCVDEDDNIYQHLWYNNNIKVDSKPIYFKRWADRDIFYVYDLLDENGSLIQSYDIFCAKHNFYPPITQFDGLHNAIRATWYAIQNRHHTFSLPHCPIHIYYILTNKQRGPSVYNLFIKNLKTNNKYITKWSEELNLVEGTVWWKKINIIPFKSTIDCKLRWFQYRIIHRIISTNKYLHMINLKDSPLCTFCNRHTETIVHIFWECRLVAIFWEDFKVWLYDDTLTNLQLHVTDVILGKLHKDQEVKYLNTLVLIAKFHIYKQKIKNCLLCINGFIKELDLYLKTEEVIYKNNMECDSFVKKWSI
ncbi:uncharacterized protein LOC117339468 isoform X1 [Pecten maximus]|uniref:uncharacterized protein LOC117339468 isoform X1 n=1 Tax=Pecten maximus TaxID=6579 RepID=UPI00145888AA|nr:uncharacterized protein LOC117339468 isoform X1 [Pecten maximus]XP_033756946.1 uncharacterized protein LOC117339468 isoform X1 [Pecten maximus]